MRFAKKKIVMLGIIAVMGAGSATAFAASAYQTPAEAVAGITGKTVQEVITESNESSKSFGTIALEAGKLEEFKQEMLEMNKDYYTNLVKNGTISQAEADDAIASIGARQAICDGSGYGACGRNQPGYRNGGRGYGRGYGRGLRNGSCVWR